MTLLSYHKDQLRIEAMRMSAMRDAWSLAGWIVAGAVLLAIAAQPDVAAIIQGWRG